MITAAEVDQNLRYDPDTGLFYRRLSGPGVKAGSIAGGVHPNGAVYLRVAGSRKYLAHRLAWLLTYGRMPDCEIDHINGVRSDNRISNLREATHAENSCNRKLNADNKTGFKGVTRHGAKFQATIRHCGRDTYLGLFVTAESAHEAYCAAALNYHGRFARLA